MGKPRGALPRTTPRPSSSASGSTSDNPQRWECNGHGGGEELSNRGQPLHDSTRKSSFRIRSTDIPQFSTDASRTLLTSASGARKRTGVRRKWNQLERRPDGAY